jgi:hypothetical protein
VAAWRFEKLLSYSWPVVEGCRLLLRTILKRAKNGGAKLELLLQESAFL